MAGAKRFEELVAWQLSERVKEEVFRLTTRTTVAHDRKFCEQIQESARSTPANIAEGFSRYEPKPFANHVSIAKASLDETKNHTHDGFKRGYFDVVERDALLRLIVRALVATTRLVRYLRSCKNAPAPRPYQVRAKQPPKHDPTT